MKMRTRKSANYRPSNLSVGATPRPTPVRIPASRKDSKKESTKKAKCFRLLLSITGTFVIMLIIAISLSPKIDPVAYKLEPPMAFVGPLTPNNELLSSDRMYDYLIRGPEGIAFDKNDNIYTGTLNGKIMKIDIEGRMKEFASLGPDNCTSAVTCGRPLGLRVDPTGKFLYVVDAYLGLYKIDLKTGKAVKVFPFSEDFIVRFFNDLEFMPNGDVIISQSSTKYHLHEISHEVLEASQTGRLILLSQTNSSQKFRSVYNGIGFANGVQLNLRDKNSVLVAETTRDRIMRIFVHGPRRGEAEVFANLPGMPDNIRVNEAGDGYWVGIAIVRGASVGNSLRDLVMERPYVRNIISKIIPRPLIYYLGRTYYGLAVHLDLDGRIVESLHDPTGTVIRDVAQITERAGSLYLTNYDNTYIGRLDRGCKITSSCRFQIKPEPPKIEKRKEKKEL